VEARAKLYGLDLYQQTGVCRIQDEYCGRTSVHLDAFHWVQRDSYLPQGAQGLKAVTKYKLGYDPVEVDPEDMLRFAHEKPVHMATYSVSDAVATYYLYEKYVHLFIFSLSTIIPMGPEDVLRKGSGTLCEALLMVQACQKSIICPNKQVDEVAKFHKGHLLESETYIGGKVECLETGVYRSDIEYEFDLQPSAFQQLIDNVDRDLTFAIEVEGGQQRDDIVNYGEVRTRCGTSPRTITGKLPHVLSPFCCCVWRTDSHPDSPRAGTAPGPTPAHRKTLHLSSGCRCHVPQHYSNEPPAAECHRGRRDVRRV
jgi:DNA polymerase epsilon subunit 1